VTGIISGCTFAVRYGSSHVFSGIVSGCTDAVRDATGIYFSGTVSGCNQGLNSSACCVVAGTISGCNYGAANGGGHTISGAISGCNYALSYTDAKLIGAIFSGNTNNVAYSSFLQGQARLVRAYDFNGTPGDTRSWSAGGYGATDATTPAPAFADSHKFTMVDVKFWSYHQDEIMAYKDRPLIISVGCKNGATGLTERARVELIEGPAEDPFVSGTPSQQLIASDDIDWHIDRWFVMPTTDTTYWLRGSAKHGSGNAYVAWRVEPVESD
jgi:hypothetical protein